MLVLSCLLVLHTRPSCCGASISLLSLPSSSPSRLQVKKPGLEMAATMSELDLSYAQRYQGVVIPEAYERLILDRYDLTR